MELTVLGRYSPFPAVGGAMNGYLVRHGATTLLLDAGNGVAGRLQQHVKIEELTALVLSHLHEDHIADAHSLRFMQLDALMAKRTEGKLQIYAPAEPVEQHRWLEGGEDWQELHTYDPAQPLVIGELAITFTRTNHPIPCYAMRIKPVGAEGPVLFYTADTGESAAVTEAARGADLMLVEASLTEEYISKRIYGHLTAAEAAAMGREAGAKRVLLTHIYPGLEPEQLLAEARPVLATVEMVEEHRTYSIRRSESMRVGIPVYNGQIFGHFGQADTFLLFDMDNGQIAGQTEIDTAYSGGHDANVLALKEQGVTHVIVDNIGPGALGRFARLAIAVTTGVSGDPLEAALRLAAGTLVGGENRGGSDCDCGCGGQHQHRHHHE